MKELIKDVLIFVAGAGLGALVTNKIVKNKYQSIADEEIAQIRELYCIKREEGEPCQNVEEDSSDETEDHSSGIEVVDHIVEKNNYASKSETPKDVVLNKDEPYYIEEDEYGDDELYDPIELYYYTDGVLADDIDERATPGIVPPDFADHFAYGNEVFVRNPKFKEDIQILKMDTTYAELCEEKPHLKYRD